MTMSAASRRLESKIVSNRAMSPPAVGRPADELDAEIRAELGRCVAPERNLGSYITTTMLPSAAAVLHAAERRTTVDGGSTVGYERRCVEALAGLWRADAPTVVGVASSGSSEAAFLALAALVRRRPAAARPNLVLGANNHVCWAKACDYLGVEARVIGSIEGRLDPGAAAARCDENTVGVVGVLGSPFTGGYDPVAEVCARLDDLAGRTGVDVPVHVDAASGGFVAPFLDQDRAWDFRLDRVASINVSSHKYGQVYAALGWTLWRDASALPESMTYHVECLGGRVRVDALSFTRNLGPIAAQHFLFQHWGSAGYTRLLGRLRAQAVDLAATVDKHSAYQVLARGDEAPVVAFTMAPGERPFGLDDLAEQLGRRGWYLPTYPLATGERMARIVVRADLTDELATELSEDIAASTETLLVEGGRPAAAACRL